MTTIMYVSAILAVVIILTIIGVLSRYLRCKPNQVLVVYGKTGGEKKVKSESAVKTAKELADKEVEEAKAKKVQAALKAEKIVPAETQKEEAILQADAEAEKIKRRADAEAAAHLAEAAFIDFLPAGTVLY